MQGQYISITFYSTCVDDSDDHSVIQFSLVKELGGKIAVREDEEVCEVIFSLHALLAHVAQLWCTRESTQHAHMMQTEWLQ